MAILEETIPEIKNIDVATLARQTRTLEETVCVNPAFNDLILSLRSRLQAFVDTLTLSCFIHVASTRQGPAYNKGKIK